jgi:hypothetical protein
MLHKSKYSPLKGDTGEAKQFYYHKEAGYKESIKETQTS